MGFSVRSFGALALSVFLISTSASGAYAQEANDRDRHEHLLHGRRHVKGPPVAGGRPRRVSVSTTPSGGVLKYITPSPGATPVAVTMESQIVTSYVPQFTLCELPPIAFFPISPSTSASTTAPSYSISIPTDFGNCTTIYDPTITMVCATTLTALDKQYIVTNCNEDLTFSTEYGYALATAYAAVAASASSASSAANIATITAGPSIQTLTTYYLAPWQQLTAGTAPSEVDLKVCRTFDNGTTECIREYQIWETSLVTLTATTVTSINISTTIHGSSQLIVETFVANVTEMLTTFSMSTTMDLEFQTEYTTTNSAARTVSTNAIAPSTGPDVYQTRTLEHAPSSQQSASEASASNSGIVAPTVIASAAGASGGDGTTTVHMTSTVIAGTSTVTVSGSVGSSAVNFGSMLGVER